jgi:hypothetical protein
LEFKKNRCYRVDGTVGNPDVSEGAPAGDERSYLRFKGNGATIDGSFFTPPQYTDRPGIGLHNSDRPTQLADPRQGREGLGRAEKPGSKMTVGAGNPGSRMTSRRAPVCGVNEIEVRRRLRSWVSVGLVG